MNETFEWQDPNFTDGEHQIIDFNGVKIHVGYYPPPDKWVVHCPILEGSSVVLEKAINMQNMDDAKILALGLVKDRLVELHSQVLNRLAHELMVSEGYYDDKWVMTRCGGRRVEDLNDDQT